MYFTNPDLQKVLQFALLRPDILQLLRLMRELACISLGKETPLIGLLHIEFISLLLSKADGIVLCLEVQLRRLHEVAGGLPSHELGAVSQCHVANALMFWRFL